MSLCFQLPCEFQLSHCVEFVTRAVLEQLDLPRDLRLSHDPDKNRVFVDVPSCEGSASSSLARELLKKRTCSRKGSMEMSISLG